MKLSRLIGSLLVMAGLFGLVGPSLSVFGQGKDKDKGATKDKKDTKSDTKDKTTTGKPGDLKWKAFDLDVNKEFYQTLETKTSQTMKVQGMEVKQDQFQVFYIKWIPQKKEGDNWVVTQRIVGVKMDIDIGGNKISYDSTAAAQPQNPMTDFFKALLELDLKFHISSKDMKVVKIEGNDEFIKKLSKTNPQMEGLLRSILSEDALKKMTEPTLFAFPTEAVKAGSTWKKESTLSLGPIGSYKTDYTFTFKGMEKGQDKIDVKANMTYSPPAAGDKNKLPFVIKGGELSGKDGTGYALFNETKGRFDYYTLKMKLEGNLKIDIGGMETTVELSQDQNATVTTSDTNPVADAGKKK